MNTEMNKMNFKITARVVSQLGAELISSDEVAIYELAKNGFDAGSPFVEININYRMETSLVRKIQKALLEDNPNIRPNDPLPPMAKDRALALLNNLTPESRPGQTGAWCILPTTELAELRKKLNDAATVQRFLIELGRVNYIDIIDYGSGMTRDDVERYYLTIGTTHRLQQVRDTGTGGPDTDVPAGEKGIGRLSAMRLGHELEMYTVPTTGQESVYVAVHWREFEAQVEQDLADISLDVELREKDAAAPGTVITISDLHSAWPRHHAIKLASEQLAKFLDPFPNYSPAPSPRKPRTLILRWNSELIDVAAALRTYLDNCQNSLRCELRLPKEGAAELATEFIFSQSESRTRTSYRRNYTIADFSDFTEESLRSIGPFELTLYHFPRNRLKAIPGCASRSEFKSWLDNWCGGLMVFRDGLRVLPYATAGDDWLDLDSRALRGHGFRINRIQVVGFVRISRYGNPGLVDQTNREGLLDNDAFRAFKELIQRHIQKNFIPALDDHLGEVKPDWQYIATRAQEQQDAIAATVEEVLYALKRADWKSVKDGVGVLAKAADNLRNLGALIENALAEKEASKLEILELAATGMAAESMAHDLEGAVESAVATLGELAKSTPEKAALSAINHLRAVHKSLLTQIKQIAPGPARSRRRSSTFDVVQLVTDAAEVYRDRCRRHGITIDLPRKGGPMIAHAVNGHVRQILDNLFRNSIFWLEDTRLKFPGNPDAKITIESDTVAGLLRFSDTGIGIAKEDAEWVFRSFTSRRRDGRGLGLYICKELADFSGISLRLETGATNKWGRLSTFSLEFKKVNGGQP